MFPETGHQPQILKPERRFMDSGYRCPGNPEHGQLLIIRKSSKLFCPHSDHNGRPKSHPQGAAPQTQSIWEESEVERSFIKAMAATAKRNYIKRTKPLTPTKN